MRPIILRQLKYIIRPAANYRTLTGPFTLCAFSDQGESL